jgi:cytochrome c55X
MAAAAYASRRRRLGGRLPAVILRAGVLAALALTGTAVAAEPSPGRRVELTRLVRQDCGSCHGMTLKGGLGPALTPQALQDKATESLIATIISGRPGTAMPPWRNFLSGSESAWIVEQLLKGFPDER